MTRNYLTGALAAPLLLMALTMPSYGDSSPTMCKDGTTSTAAGRGACSKHGGVQKATGMAPAAASTAPAAATPAAAAASTPAASAKAAPAAAGVPAGATAMCKDGTYSMAKSHAGACSKHGGVSDWLDGK